MDYKAMAEKALEERSALYVEFEELRSADEQTEDTAAKLEELRSAMDALDEKAERFVADAEHEARNAELRNKVASINVVSRSRGTDSLGDSLRSAIRNGGGLDIAGGGYVSNTSEFRAAPVKSAGGNYTNDEFVTSVMTAFKENNALFRAGAKVLQTTSGEPINAPIVTNIGSALVAEGGAFPQTAESAKATLNAYKYGAIAQVSRELIEDSGVDIANLVAGLVADDVANTATTAFMTGTGSNQPLGLVTGATNIITTAGPTAITVAELYQLYYAVQDSARSRGAWFMSPATAAYVRTLDTDLWQVNPGTDNPSLFLGQPVFTDPNMTAIAANNRTIVFADPKAYLVRQVRGIRVDVSDEYLFGNDLYAVRVVWRGDGVITNPNAVAVLKQHA